MKKTDIANLLKQRTTRFAAATMAAMLVFGSAFYSYESNKDIPELVTYVDMEGSIEIAEDDTPLAAPKVTKTVKKTKKTKKIKLKSKSKKTYNQAGKSTTQKSTSTIKNANTTTTVETVVDTSVMNSFKKGSNIEKQTTTTTTTVTKTQVTSASTASATRSTTSANATVTVTASSSSSSSSSTAKNTGNVTIRSLASKADGRVLNAYETLGFKLKVNSSVSYSGLFDARTQTITLKRTDDTVYHELGHFVAFIAGNVDISQAFKSIYAAEKDKYKGYNKGYVTSSASEYFAESFKDYTLAPGNLKASRPQTYAAVEAAVNKITPNHVAKVANVYGSIWK